MDAHDKLPGEATTEAEAAETPSRSVPATSSLASAMGNQAFGRLIAQPSRGQAAVALQARPASRTVGTPLLRPAPISIQRKKVDPSPFKGAAGTADVRAGEASQAAAGLAPIKVSQEYAKQQAERKEQQMNAFLREDIPFVSDNQDHYGYKKLIELRQEYVNDASRIALAEGAYNDVVLPGTLANKSAAAFKTIQFELGFFDDTDPTEDLSAKDKKALAKNLDEGKITDLNAAVGTKEQMVRGLRTEILGTSHSVQAAMQKRAAVLATDARAAAEKDKGAIDEKIKAVTDGFEAVGSVIGAVSFAGFGLPSAVSDIAAGGATAVKGGLEIGEKATGVIGATAEFVMTEMYKEQIQKAKQEIEKAKAAETHAKKMDAELSLTGSMLTVEGQLDQLGAAMGEMAAALKERKAYFAQLGADTDKARGNRAGGAMAQYLSYVSQAAETKSHLETARGAATNGLGVMKTQIADIAKHREYRYVADAAGVWDDARKQDDEGPDLKQLRSGRFALEDFLKAADAQLKVVDDVVASLPKPE
jgi:hypothetical protein